MVDEKFFGGRWGGVAMGIAALNRILRGGGVQAGSRVTQ